MNYRQGEFEMETGDPLYLLDAYSLIYRSYFAFINRPLRNPKGENVSAFFGFFRTLLSFFESYSPRHFAVIMDSRTPTFRHEMYKEYKANREKAPEDLHAQVPLIEEVLSAMNLGIIRRDGMEADDIMATLADECSREGRNCYLISGDKDLLQLVNNRVKVLRPDNGDYREIGVGEVEEELGVRAEQIVDYLSLIGDQADNIPGVRGIGPKTAVKLLSSYESLEGIYEHLDECTKSERKKLEEGRDSAFLSRKLIMLTRDLEIDSNEEIFSLQAFDKKAAVPIFLREGAKGLAEQAGDEKSTKNRAEGQPGKQPNAPSKEQAKESKEQTKGQIPGDSAFTGGGPHGGVSEPQRGVYTAVETMDQAQSWINEAIKAGTFAFDVETDNIDEMYANPVGFSLAVKSGEACYLPLIAGSSNFLPEEELKEALRPLLEDEELRLLGHNFKYDYKVLSRWGVTPRNLSFDTMIAAWLIDTTASSYGMDSLAEKWMNYRTIRYKDVVPKGSPFSVVSVGEATDYAAEDADVTYRLYELFLPELKGQGQESLFYDMEMPLIPILAQMELRGVTLVSEPLKQYSRELDQELKGIEKEIYRECGREFNINSTKQLQEILFEVRKLKPIKKTKTGYSTDVSVLEELAKEDAVPELVLRHRSLSKLKSTYVDTLPSLVHPETGKIHTKLLQTGTATGRLSSRDPNLQNIPIREEAGRRIRRAFVPDPGYVLVSADYSQIELVVLAHLSGDPALKEAFTKGEDVHRHTGGLIFGIEPAEVSSEQRRIAKTINFGVMYGMSAFRLSRELEIPRARAEEFISAYFNRYAAIARFIDDTVRKAEKLGYAETMFGRRRVIPGINSSNRTEKQGAERIAVNTPIQGTAAEIVKTAMIRINRRIQEEHIHLSMLLQIHDELIFEAPEERAERLAALVREEMEKAVELDVPLKVSVETGESWGDLHQ
ncbi:MAG: DNA polymerase I [Spirochaetia bacterium]